MAKLIDLTGQQFNYWTVLKKAPSRKGQTYWLCKCKCGTIREVNAYNLTTGGSKSCGCYKNIITKYEDLTNQKFGRLTVISKAENHIQPDGSKIIRWNCKCDCGNTSIVSSDHLKRGKVKSCGCLRKEINIKNSNNLIGQKFGKLLVIEKDNSKTNFTGNYWKCQCDCGNITSVRTEHLSQGHIKSCGCLKSVGESNIANILIQNNISYIKEYQIKELGKLRFDFYLPEYNRLIEFDGEQHFKPIPIFGGEEGFQYNQQRDNRKNQYAQSHHIELVRIPYWERDNLNLDLILGDKYLINEELTDGES